MAAPVELRLTPTITAAKFARQALDGLSGELRPEEADNIRLLISELVTNSVRHAGLNKEQPITMRISVTEGRIRVEVRDVGRGFDPRKLPAPAENAGWGLYLVERIADRWGVTKDGATCVWFELDRATV